MDSQLKYFIFIKALVAAGEHGVTRKEITTKLSEYDNGKSPSRATIFRWRNKIEELFGLNIEWDGLKQRYILMNPDALKDGSLSKWLLDTMTTTSVLSDSKSLKDRIVVDSVPSGYEFMEQIVCAMKGNFVLRMTYQKFNTSEAFTFDVEPYSLRLFERRWYLLARNCYLDKLRIYALDRIEDLVNTNSTFILPDTFDANEYFSTFYGVVTDTNKPIERIVLWADEDQKNYLRTLPLHHSQRELEDNGYEARFEYNMRITFDLVMKLLSFGNSIGVEEPKWLQDELKTWAEEVVKVYDDEE